MELEPLLVGLCWVCLGLVLYTYLGYPLVIGCLARCLGRRPRAPQAEMELPSVSLLIAAHNEETDIAARIESALAMDYPPEKLEIVIASDGSTDATAALVERYADRGVRLLNYPERRGKATVLNAAFPCLKGELVLLSDANTLIEPDAVRKLVRWFADPNVGVVCGRLLLTDPVTGKNVDSLYWRYETFLKRCEGRLGALLGANGGIYLVRKELYAPIPNDTIIDDFVLPLQVRLRSGCALVYDEEAVAREETPPWIGSEFQRRSRIGAGGFQSMLRLWKLLNPAQGWTAFTFFSHKVLRWLCPFFLLGLLAACLALAEQRLYRFLLFDQVGFYLVSWLAALLPVRLRLLRPLRLTTLFTGMNIALLVGFWRWVRGEQKAAWRRTARLAQTGGPLECRC